MTVAEEIKLSTIEQMIALVDLSKLEDTLEYLAEENFGVVDLSWHIEKWARNKEHIFKLLGNKLKAEQEVENVLTSSAIHELFVEFLNEALEDRHCFVLAKYFLNDLSTDDIASNTISRSVSILGTEFKVGMKISRILGQLVHKDYAHEIQTKYSMFLQKLKAKGRAVISIDPIDYLTMSANRSGWRSCHALDGEYRTGTLAYMIDPSTTICYVKTAQDIVISTTNNPSPYLDYSNKTWRQIALVDTSIAIQGRQYPSNSDNNATTISNMFVQLFKQSTGKEYCFTNTSCSTLNLYVENGDYYDEKLWYNDFDANAFSKGNMVHELGLEIGELTATLVLGARVRSVDGLQWLSHSAYLSENNYESSDDDEWDEDYDNDEDEDNNNDW
jgi:hypothetical protein